MRARHGKRRVLQFPPTSLFRSSGTYVSQTRSSMRLHASSTSARQRELTLAAAQMSFIAGRTAPRWLEGHASSALTIHSITSRSSASGRSASTRGMAAAFVGSLQQRTKSWPRGVARSWRPSGRVSPLTTESPTTHYCDAPQWRDTNPARSRVAPRWEQTRNGGPNALKRPHDPSHGAQRAPPATLKLPSIPEVGDNPDACSPPSQPGEPRGMWTSNRMCQAAIMQRNRDIHLQRLREARPSIDTRDPRRPKGANGKAQRLEEERNAQIM